MADLIDRENVLKELWKEPMYTDPLNVLAEARDRIERLPSEERANIGNVLKSIAIDMHKQTRLLQELIMTLEKMRKGQR